MCACNETKLKRKPNVLVMKVIHGSTRGSSVVDQLVRFGI